MKQQKLFHAFYAQVLVQETAPFLLDGWSVVPQSVQCVERGSVIHWFITLEREIDQPPVFGDQTAE